MFERIITPDVIERATIRAEQVPDLRNSITNNQAKVHGAVGEEIVNEVWPGLIVNLYDYDILANLNGEPLRLEVKSKQTPCEPRPDWDVNLSKLNDTQDCDYYVFTRVQRNLAKCWFLGVMAPEEFKSKATPYEKGELFDDNKNTCKAACWNLKINRLYMPEKLPDSPHWHRIK